MAAFEIKEFLCHISVSPLEKAARAKSLFLVLIWLVILLVSFIICCYQTVSLVSKLKIGNKVARPLLVDSNELKFPAVTFCNLNPYKNSAVSSLKIFTVLQNVSNNVVTSGRNKRDSNVKNEKVDDKEESSFEERSRQKRQQTDPCAPDPTKYYKIMNYMSLLCFDVTTPNGSTYVILNTNQDVYTQHWYFLNVSNSTRYVIVNRQNNFQLSYDNLNMFLTLKPTGSEFELINDSGLCMGVVYPEGSYITTHQLAVVNQQPIRLYTYQSFDCSRDDSQRFIIPEIDFYMDKIQPLINKGSCPTTKPEALIPTTQLSTTTKITTTNTNTFSSTETQTTTSTSTHKATITTILFKTTKSTQPLTTSSSTTKKSKTTSSLVPTTTTTPRTTKSTTSITSTIDNLIMSNSTNPNSISNSNSKKTSRPQGSSTDFATTDVIDILNIRIEEIKPETLIKVLNLELNSDNTSRQTTAQAALAYFMSSLTDNERMNLGFQKSDVMQSCMFNDRKCDNLDINQWNDLISGNCFTFNHKTLPKPHMSRRAGNKFGLKILFNVMSNEYLPMTMASGVKVIIHDPNDAIFTDVEGEMVSTGYAAQFSLIYQEINRNTKNCITESDSTMNFNENDYSYESCIRSCYQERIIDICACADPGVAIRKSVPQLQRYCGVNEISCVQSVYDRNASDGFNCSSCLLPCKEKLFHKTKTLSKLQIQNNSSRFKFDIVAVNVFYRSLSYIILEENYEYTVDCFLSDLGGIVGMSFDASFITIFEVVFLVTILVSRFIDLL